jgi:beta-1,2-mannobiose phosphorylase / 1,2-beta-oligomannan phosphorylase
MTQYETLFHRHPANPILSGKNWPYSMNSVFNAGATSLPDGSTLLLCRVEDRRGHSHLCVARSLNGVDGWQIDREPTLMPDPLKYPEELWGIEDPRITYVPELAQYAIAYTSYSRSGPGVSLALTKDFRNFDRLAVVMTPDDKDAALLPTRIDGYWDP